MFTYFKEQIGKIKLRNDFTVNSREPFYLLAKKYIPESRDAVILDIGCGKAEFTSCVDPNSDYKNFFLLDANPETVGELKKVFKNVILYKAPQSIPFADNSVDYIHCSHLIEHLLPDELYKFLKEIDRIFKKDGFLIISSPLLWDKFYDDLSHTRPYNPSVLVSYLSGGKHNSTRELISNNYQVEKLIFRYCIQSIDEGVGSYYLFIDLIIKLLRKGLFMLGIKSFKKNGYTIIFKKIQSG